MRMRRDDWPWWVQLTFVGVPSRRAALLYFWLSIVTAIACVAVAFAWPPAAFGGLMALAAGWYHFGIAWVDRHGRWD
jgi:hypothetical protein